MDTPPSKPPRVLVEAEDPAAAFARLRILAAAGYEVAWCEGPEGHRFRQCPLVRGAPCALVDSADVVVTCLGMEHSSARQILSSIDRRGTRPVVVETTLESADRWMGDVGPHRVVAAPATPRELLGAVTEALRSRP